MSVGRLYRDLDQGGIHLLQLTAFICEFTFSVQKWYFHPLRIYPWPCLYTKTSSHSSSSQTTEHFLPHPVKLHIKQVERAALGCFCSFSTKE